MWFLRLLAGLALSGWAAAQSGLNTSQLQGLMGSIQGTLLNMAQENSASEGYTELPLADYLRRGPAPYFAPSVPAYYLLAEGTEDVLLGVKFALDNGLKLSFRGGGHHQAGVSLLEGSLTIDMAALKAISIEPETSLCTFQAGLLGIELANATAEYGLHYRIGHAASNGVAGFTLGGGGGWGGIAVDQIRGMSVVNIWEYPEEELRIVNVTADSEPELFFALQGAGQMLGAVLAFTAELQPLPPSNIIRSVETVIPLSSAAVAWPIWLDYLASTPFTSYVETGSQLSTAPDIGPALVISIFDWSPTNDSTVEAFIDGWISLAQQADVFVEDLHMPYYDVLTELVATQQYDNVTHYALSAVVPDLMVGDLLEVFVAGYANATSPLSLILADYIDTGGKSNNETAYGWRGQNVIYIWAFWQRTAGGAAVDGDAEHVAWVRGIWEQIEAYSQGYYLNFVDFDGPGQTQASFPEANWPRIVAAKAAYDPHNLLRDLYFYHNQDGRGPLNGAATAASQ